MPKCIIDGREAEFSPGENLIEVAKRVGVEIPAFCYHPGLSVVAQCRMCAVEIEKMPKLQTACSTPATEGMIVKTQTPKVVQQQKGVMEFLLINHPLDCPVCDKAGECDLQDQSFKFGDPYSRYQEEKRTYVDLDMGGVISKNMNRCIHCTRCIRFGAEVAGIREMVAIRRGNNTEITTIDGRPLETDYAGNYADVCPTGSLLLKDFKFKKRSWFLKRTATICEGCSRGCNMEAHQDSNIVYRCVPRENMKVNKHWMCDEGRFHFKDVQTADRVVHPSISTPTTWEAAVSKAKEVIKNKKALVLLGSDLTQEEVTLIKSFAASQLVGAVLSHFGTPGIVTAADDAPADKLLKRKSKTANIHGLEKLGISGFRGTTPDVQVALVFTGGRAVVPDLKGLPSVGIGVFKNSDLSRYQVVMPGIHFLEKDGTIVNFDGIEQSYKRAVLAPKGCKDLKDILTLWTT